MKNIILFAWACMASNGFLYGQGYFSKLLETPFPYVGAIWGAIETPDSGFILMHTSFDIFQDTNKINIVKIDKNGERVWAKSYGAAGTAHDQLGIIKTNDSCYVFCGGEWKNDIYSAFLFKINEDGDSIWMKAYNAGFYFGFFNKVIETNNNDLICIGGYDKTPVSGVDPWRQIYIVKTDNDGNMLWQKNYGSGDLNDNGRDIVETPDKGFICSGYVGYPYATSDFYVHPQIMKIDSNGVTKWVKTYSSNEYNQTFIEINKTSDDNYLITGEYANNRYVLTSDPNGTGGILLKIDADGNTLWFKRYGDEILDAGCYDFVELPDSSIMTVGISYQPQPASRMVKFNKNGEILSVNTYTYGANIFGESLFTILHTKDNGFLMTGHAPPFDTVSPLVVSKGWILKVDSLGCPIPMCVVSIEEPDEDDKLIQIFPNPFTERIFVQFPTANHFNKINIFDMTGTLRLSQDIESQISLEIDTDDLTSGIYFMEVVSERKRITQKIIKIE